MRLTYAFAAALFAAATLFPAAPAPAAEQGEGEDLIMPTLGDDGLYHQDWFLNSFLMLGEDHRTAADADKRFVVFFEQKGCPYCEKMQTEVLSQPHVNRYVRENFEVLQLDLWGSRTVTDFRGEEMPEKRFAQQCAVTFTPTLIFFAEDPAAAEGKTCKEAEVFRLPGFFRPFHFMSAFMYVDEKRYAEGQNFQRYIMERVQEEQAAGNESPAE